MENIPENPTDSSHIHHDLGGNTERILRNLNTSTHELEPSQKLPITHTHKKSLKVTDQYQKMEEMEPDGLDGEHHYTKDNLRDTGKFNAGRLNEMSKSLSAHKNFNASPEMVEIDLKETHDSP